MVSYIHHEISDMNLIYSLANSKDGMQYKRILRNNAIERFFRHFIFTALHRQFSEIGSLNVHKPSSWSSMRHCTRTEAESFNKYTDCIPRRAYPQPTTWRIVCDEIFHSFDL